MLEDFVESGRRITDKFQRLLKSAEAPMLDASSKKDKLGRSSGVRFVETLFGREHELVKSERFMQQARLWSMRLDANCAAVLERRTGQGR